MVRVVPSLLPEEEPVPSTTAQPLASEPNPIAILARAMRGRWTTACCAALLLGGLAGIGGFLSGAETYESQAILRVYPQESNILYATGDDSVLKTFDSFVKAETSYVASHLVMARALAILAQDHPEIAAELSVSRLTSAVGIRRNDSLIVLSTADRQPGLAAAKLAAVIAAYLALTAETEEARTAVRLAELFAREAEIAARIESLQNEQLEIGGEYGISAITQAHVEKISQIDTLNSRMADVAATLAAIQSNSGNATADTSSQDIMRATLLDRTMADLGFERAKLLSDLASLRAGYGGQSNLRFENAERGLVEAIAVIEAALADRREQIRILGQTGALTDTSAVDEDATAEELRTLFAQIESQLATARQEARDLNHRRIALERIDRDIEETKALLEETRRALEVIRLESGRALPGYTVLMSPPSNLPEPAEDSRKTNAAVGFVGGASVAMLIMLALGLRERRIRFAETLEPVIERVPVVQVSRAGDADAHAADQLRNELQLKPLRRPRLVGKAPVIAVAAGAGANTSAAARALAESYARARMRTLLIEGDLACACHEETQTGWADILSGSAAEMQTAPATHGLWKITAGRAGVIDDSAVSGPMVRTALNWCLGDFDVVIVSAGSLQHRLSCQFLLAAADVGVLLCHPSDPKAAILSQIDRLDELPRNGSVAVMRNALPGDPWLVARP